MVVFVPKSCLFDFLLLIFLESYREIDTVQCKNPIIVTDMSERICKWGHLSFTLNEDPSTLTDQGIPTHIVCVHNKYTIFNQFVNLANLHSIAQFIFLRRLLLLSHLTEQRFL